MAVRQRECLIYTKENKDRLPKQVLDILLHQFKIAAWEMDVKRELLYPNETIANIFGDQRAPVKVPDYLLARGLYHEDSIVDFKRMHKQIQAGEANICCEGRIKLTNGAYFWAKVRYILFFDGETKPYWAIGCYENITAMKEMNERYKQLRMYRNVFTADAVIAYEVDLDDDVILRFDKGSMDTDTRVGSLFSGFIQKVAKKSVHPDFKRAFLEKFSREALCLAFKRGKREIVFEFISNENGLTYRWLRETVKLVCHAETNHVCAFFYIKNIDKEKNEEIELKEIANSDPLTHLYNRNAFERAVNEYIEKDRTKAKVAAFIMLDVDNFKSVNDTYGHVFGDTVLCMYADKIREIFCADDLVGRLGGDEFVVFVKDIKSKDFAIKAAQKICMTFRTWRTDGNYSFETSCSVGVAMYPLHGQNFTSLYQSADEAQYYAKKNGKNHSCMYGAY